MPRRDIEHPFRTGNHPCAFCKRVCSSMESIRLHEKSRHGKAIRKALKKLKENNDAANSGTPQE